MEPYESLLKYAPQEGLVLDAGCGFFEKTNFLKRHNNRIKIVCTDIITPDPSLEKANFLLASVEELPFKENSFDFIYCLSVLNLIKDDLHVIDEFHRILKPKGQLLFTVMAARSMFRLIRDLQIACGVYRSTFDTKDFHYYTRRDIRTLILNKFKPMDLYGYSYNFIPRLRHFFMCLVGKYVLGDTMIKSTIKEMLPQFSLRKNGNPRNRDGQLHDKSSRLLRACQNRFKFLSDFSYHYIVVVEKI